MKLDKPKSGGFVPYMKLFDRIEVTHSLNEPVLVYFEEPDPVYFFKNATVDLDKMLVESREGFDDEEMSFLIDFCRNNKQLIKEYSKCGGAYYA